MIYIYIHKIYVIYIYNIKHRLYSPLKTFFFSVITIKSPTKFMAIVTAYIRHLNSSEIQNTHFTTFHLIDEFLFIWAT